jgi:AcrR family transcriptional regulator
MKTNKSLIKKEKILSAAAKIFCSKGYAETTLSDIAAEADTLAGSLYYHFSSKDAIVEEVLNLGTSRVAQLVMDRVDQLPVALSKTECLKTALRLHLSLSMDRDDFALAYWKIIDQVPGDLRARHAHKPRAYGRFFQKLFSEAQEAGELRTDIDARMATLLILGSTLYAIDWFDQEGRYSIDDLADMLFVMIFEGASTAGADKLTAPAKGGAKDNRTRPVAK